MNEADSISAFKMSVFQQAIVSTRHPSFFCFKTSVRMASRQSSGSAYQWSVLIGAKYTIHNRNCKNAICSYLSTGRNQNSKYRAENCQSIVIRIFMYLRHFQSRKVCRNDYWFTLEKYYNYTCTIILSNSAQIVHKRYYAQTFNTYTAFKERQNG